MTGPIPFDNSYARLPETFFTRLSPTPVRAPELIAFNAALAGELGLDAGFMTSPQGIEIMAGNSIAEGSEPLAQVYAGHQFGGWSPQLGDGRAVLLGEVATPQGRRDLQLKGSGPTPYSRMGDGRAWLGPVLREYLVSEAMHALGIPTTRALAAVTTGEIVLREAPFPGAILTRVAASHIRVGTFQFFASRQDVTALSSLTDHVIARHYPQAGSPLGLLRAVTAAQARLVAQWMAVGFVHGVMNTDNTAISGETIDYGPCAFMDAYHPMRVFSSIDQMGRYAFGRQPDILVWNLAQFATALLPLMGQDRNAAIAEATEAIEGFAPAFRDHWLTLHRAKLGLARPEPEDEALIHALLDVMAEGRADFTNTFRALPRGARDWFTDRDAFDIWEARWRARLTREGATPQDRAAAMDAVNPAIIPRTHRIEEAIQASISGDYTPFFTLHAALAQPFGPAPEALTRPPSQDEIVPQTFCGT